MEKSYLPNFTGKCLSLIIENQESNLDLISPRFEYQGNRLFIIGTVPVGAVESDWAANSTCAIAWEKVTNYYVFEDLNTYFKAVSLAKEHDEDEDDE